MTKEDAIEKAKKDRLFLKNNPEWNNDKDVALAAIKCGYSVLPYISEALRGDKELIMEALKQYQNILDIQYASDEIKSDKKIFISLAKKNFRALSFAPKSLLSDKSFMMKSIEASSYTLQFASDELKNDKEVVLSAVQQNGAALEYASDGLRNDKEIVLAAIQKYGYTLSYASNELKDDKEVILTAVKENGYALEYASEELKKDKEVILTAIRQDIDVCEYSLLEGYQDFDEIVEKEGEEFLFSCWKNKDWEIRIRVANHPDFLPTEEQIAVGLKDGRYKTQQIYKLRKDEWLAKIEENKLKSVF